MERALVPSGLQTEREALERAYADFEQGDVVKVPWPCTGRPMRRSRPARAVAAGGDNGFGPLWILTIASAEALPGTILARGARGIDASAAARR